MVNTPITIDTSSTNKKVGINVDPTTASLTNNLHVNGDTYLSIINLPENFQIQTFPSHFASRNATGNGWSQLPGLQIRNFSNSAITECLTLSSNGVLSTNAFHVENMITIYSDNRLKHNEVQITNALDIINQLQAKKYQKTSVALDENFNGDLSNYDWNWEVGFIAQEVENVEDLNFSVTPPHTTDEGRYYPSTLQYDNIFVYNVAATKELYNIVKEQQNIIENLTTRISELESRLS